MSHPTDRTLPTLSVAVCSAGRAALVAGCVAHLVSSQHLLDGDEVIVVLNGDGRGAARRRLEPPPTGVRVVDEARPGLSRARNRALDEAVGDIVVFVDDDARPHDGWLDAWRTAFAAPDPPAAAGGPVELVWPGAHPPWWYDRRFDPYYSALDLGPTPDAVTDLPPTSRAFGANFAVRRAAALDLGGFDLRFGRGGTVLDGGEESDLLDRLDQRGERVGWVAAARVGHLVGPERAHFSWVLRRAHSQGVADAAFGADSPSLPRLLASGWGALLSTWWREPERRRTAAGADLVRRARDLGRHRGAPLDPPG